MSEWTYMNDWINERTNDQRINTPVLEQHSLSLNMSQLKDSRKKIVVMKIIKTKHTNKELNGQRLRVIWCVTVVAVTSFKPTFTVCKNDLFAIVGNNNVFYITIHRWIYLFTAPLYLTFFISFVRRRLVHNKAFV